MDGAWLSLAGIVVALAALGGTLWQGYLLRKQLSQTEQISRSQFYYDIASRFVELNKIFIDRPELWKYFHASCAVPTDEAGRATVNAVSAMIANLADVCYTNDRILSDLSSDWDRYFRHIYSNSPSFRKFWSENGRFWPDRISQSFMLADEQIDRAVSKTASRPQCGSPQVTP